jgi:hypothetical protein
VGAINVSELLCFLVTFLSPQKQQKLTVMQDLQRKKFTKGTSNE